VACPDTSPRGDDVPNDEASDFGQGAGFYVDAVLPPYSRHYRMRSYIAQEFPKVIGEICSVDWTRLGIFGHSMGGHGALTIGLNNPDLFRSISAFSPIVAPSQVPWGRKAFTGYLGSDESLWRAYDAVALVRDGKSARHILIDIGTADPFYERELKPDLFEAACREAGVAATIRKQEGYDHSYYFVSSFMAEHLKWHAERLGER
jgi:S-formylglutathione hydrolase